MAHPWVPPLRGKHDGVISSEGSSTHLLFDDECDAGKGDVSSRLRVKHAMLDQCQSAICDFFNVTTLSVTSLEMPMSGSPKAN